MSFSILYATETGTSEDLASLFARHLLLCDCKLDYYGAFDEQGSSFLATVPTTPTPASVLIMFISTTGKGNIPKSADQTWSFLKQRSLPPDHFKGQRYVVFGLGDMSYGAGNYCRAARLFEARLEQLGATRAVEGFFVDTRLADVGQMYQVWRQRLDQVYGLKECLTQLPPRVMLREAPSGQLASNQTRSMSLLDNNAECVSNLRLTPTSHFQNVCHVTIALDGGPSEKDIALGDVATIWPQNSPQKIDKLVKYLGLDPKELVQVCISPQRPDCSSNLKRLDGQTVLVWDLLARTVDLERPPSQSAFAVLASLDHRVPLSPMFKEKLLEISTDYDLYLDYAWRPKRTPLEVLQDFDLRLSKELLFEYFEVMKPRMFSLAGIKQQDDPLSTDNPKTLIELCVAEVEYKTVLAAMRHGLASQFICSLAPNTKFMAGIAKGSLPPISPQDRWCIFVAAGTGIAPARSMLSRHPNRARCWLVHGCRNLEMDALYREEFEGMRLGKYTVAGSRDIPPALSTTMDAPSDYRKQIQESLRLGPKDKVYVHHILKHESAAVKEWILEHGAAVYVTGNKNLPGNVQTVIDEIIAGSLENEQQRPQGGSKYEVYSETW